jgi:hypothetical protein
MPDTPTSTVDAWNLEIRVSLIVVSRQETCEARVMDGEVDFLACAGGMDCPGETFCGWTTHELGGKDPKKWTVLKMDLPEWGEAFAILVEPLGSSVQCPKVFSKPILPRSHLPYPKTIDWELPLLLIKLTAREWKYLIEGYKGRDWFVGIWTGVSPAPAHGGWGTTLGIPSLMVGKGSHSPDKFVLGPPEGRRPSSPLFDTPGEEESPHQVTSTLPGRKLFPTRSDVLIHSSKSGGSAQGRADGPALSFERLSPFIRWLQGLKTRTANLEDSLPHSFGLVRDELNEILGGAQRTLRAKPYLTS